MQKNSSEKITDSGPNSREISYLACRLAFSEKEYVKKTLQKWVNTYSPSRQEQELAQFLAAGTVKFSIACDAIARKLNPKGSLPAKGKEKALLRHTLFQVFYQPSTPFYAIASESASLAKKYTQIPFQRFLTAILKKCEKRQIPPLALHEKLSYPRHFVESLCKQYGEEKSIEILEAGNQEAKLFARERKGVDSVCHPLPKEKIQEAIASRSLYIQNPTPWHLCLFLYKAMPKAPASIWDGCSAPGGKLIALHDLYPHASLWASDLSEDRVKKLKENLSHYQIEAEVEAKPVESAFASKSWDLVVLDVPCSNSGVLRKRPEARHRLTPKKLKELASLQKQLVQSALKRVEKGGFLWYMSCSILPEENENLVRTVLKDAVLVAEKLYLPSFTGEDGGYGALLQKVS